ncbi:MAG TPA: hypothetical protein VM346_08885 [Sphingomicrobium sp.]|nr:hypothetical protein [Sphingomicrobium sp.]
MDVLHVIAGVILLIFFAILLRRSLASWLPWFAVLLVAVVNELLDLSIEAWPNRSEQFGESAKDVLLTIFLPTVLVLTARFLPDVMAARDASTRQDLAD